MAYSQSAQEFQFKQRLLDLLIHTRYYEDKRRCEAALGIVPFEELNQIARAKYESSLVSSTGTPGVVTESSTDVVRDILLLELLDWFKINFFEWMNQPSCPKCNGPTTLIGNGILTAEEIQESASRVESYTCSRCYPDTSTREIARFPRYNDPAVLLKTRIGRCGEWANCFALICRALGFEVRHVTDWLDHVWVEIYSKANGRWIHCDPCENKWDSPLLYEQGWGKQLTYVIAVTHEDIQDVTWRYTHSKNHKAVLSRRTLVNEKWLVKTIVELRNQRQSYLPEDRKAILNQRLATELVEFLSPTKPGVKDSEKYGRESGSLGWRIARGEIGSSSVHVDKIKGYEWEITEEAIRDFGFKLKLYYDCSQDVYFLGSSTNEVRRGWKNGSFESENIFRKEEKDWNMVYLARQESEASGPGQLSWKFKIPESVENLIIESVDIFIKTTSFHDAQVLIDVSNEEEKYRVPMSRYSNDVWIWKCVFSSEKTQSAKVTCNLNGGVGHLAWQHTQLFRQSTKPDPQSREPILRPLRIVVNVRKVDPGPQTVLQ